MKEFPNRRSSASLQRLLLVSFRYAASFNALQILLSQWTHLVSMHDLLGVLELLHGSDTPASC